MRDSKRLTATLRGSMLTIALLTSVAALGACSSNETSPVVVNASSPEPSTDSGTETSSDLDTSTLQVAQAPDWGHVHNLSLVGDVVYIGTHNGFWKQAMDQQPILLSQPAFDVMGLTRSNDRWLASGHPGPEMDGPADLGLIESVDGGVTWQSVSLMGEVDFHRAAAVGDFVLGLTAHSGSLLRSTDGGRTWSDLGAPSIFDLAINPADPDVIFATSEGGTLRSEDGGESFTPVVTPELLAFLAWGEQGLFAVSTQGQILFTKDSGVTWDARGSLGAAPGALATDAGIVVALVGDSVWGSTDEGMTFMKRIAGTDQH